MSKVLIIEEKYKMRREDKERLEKEYEDKIGMRCVIVDGGARTYVVDEEISIDKTKYKQDVVFNLDMTVKNMKNINYENIRTVLDSYVERKDILVKERRKYLFMHGISELKITAESYDCCLLGKLQNELVNCNCEWETSNTCSSL